MGARQPLDLLEKVRVYVLEHAAMGYKAIGLSAVTYSVDRPLTLGNPQVKIVSRRWWWTGGALKKPSTLGHRGHVQRCLSQLAKSGLMWERHKPEPGRFSGERCDKYFRIRISKDDAIAQLRKEGRKVPVQQDGASGFWTKSLGPYPGDFKWTA